MNVIVASSAGFCFGVKRAVEKARETARHADGPVFTDGPLIHNHEMMEQLRSEGILETDQPAALPPGAPLILRAHGIPPARRRALEASGSPLVDATCPDVARIQGLIRAHARKGFDIVIFGDAGHAEVAGLLGFAEGRGHVVESAADAERLPDLGRVCAVAQSTQFPADYEQVADALRSRFADVTVLDTICVSTKSRQRELFDLAPRVDAFVVVGGAHSANTLRLVRIASALRPAFHIARRDEIPKPALAAFRTVGLTAGASTPQFVLDEIRAALEAL